MKISLCILPELTYLGTLSGASSKENAVSADGSVIVGWGDLAGVAARDVLIWLCEGV